MVAVDPVLVVLIVVMVLFVFGVYLFIRRTVLGFSKGYDQGRR